MSRVSNSVAESEQLLGHLPDLSIHGKGTVVQPYLRDINSLKQRLKLLNEDRKVMRQYILKRLLPQMLKRTENGYIRDNVSSRDMSVAQLDRVSGNQATAPAPQHPNCHRFRLRGQQQTYISYWIRRRQ
jgi:hypothetical protein